MRNSSPPELHAEKLPGSAEHATFASEEFFFGPITKKKVVT
jgi:hypothetical protein